MPEKRSKEQKEKDNTHAVEHAPNFFSRMQKHAGIKAMDGESNNEESYTRKYLQIDADITGRDEPTHKNSNPIDSGQREDVSHKYGRRCPPRGRRVVVASGDEPRRRKNRSDFDLAPDRWICAHAINAETTDVARAYRLLAESSTASNASLIFAISNVRSA